MLFKYTMPYLTPKQQRHMQSNIRAHLCAEDPLIVLVLALGHKWVLVGAKNAIQGLEHQQEYIKAHLGERKHRRVYTKSQIQGRELIQALLWAVLCASFAPGPYLHNGP